MSPGSRLTRTLLRILLPLSLAGGACKLPLGRIVGVGDALAPFERPPYLQDVDTTSAVIRWLAAPDATDRAEIRVAGDSSWREVTAERSRDTIQGLAGPVLTRTIRLTGLAPGGAVQYRVSAGLRTLGPFTFHTAPRPAVADTVRVLAFGDSGWGSEDQLSLADYMLAERLDLGIHVGDIAYQVGSEEDFTLRHFQVYRELLARIPLFPSPGNHDLRSEGGRPYDRAFVWDAPFADARFYSFRWGRVVFLSLDSTDDDVPEPEDPPVGRPAPDRESDGAQLRDRRGRQIEWLETRLRAAAGDAGVRWIIVYFHHPPYSHAVGLSGHGSDMRLRRAVTPLFDRYGVDLVLSGHDHHYERSTPILHGRLASAGCGPVYVITGGGGADRLGRGIAPGPLMAAGSREHHYLRLAITDRAITGEAVGVHGESVDVFRIVEFDGLDEQGRPLGEACDG